MSTAVSDAALKGMAPGGRAAQRRRLRSSVRSFASGVPSERETQVGDGQQGTEDWQKDRNQKGDPGSHSEPTSRSGKERGKDAERPKCEESGFDAV